MSMKVERVYNFNSGPAVLPMAVLEEFRESFLNFSGMSVFEISHRSKEFEKILSEAKELLTELLSIPKNYHILFLQGGASLQFAMVPMNLMDKTADYVLTGYWAKRAISEAKNFGRVNIAFSSEELKFNKAPLNNEIKTTPDTSYLHITTNNTIYGTQCREFPETGNAPLIADMSSDILSRQIDVSKFGLIYAGAQKNLGSAGVTVVIIRDDLAAKNYRIVPTILKYSTHVENNSLYNTPPVSTIYLVNLFLKCMKKQGGLKQIEKANTAKAKMIYDVIDNSKFYHGPADKESRSLMNITFNLPNVELEEKFIKDAAKLNMVGLKGHRTVGGIRASVYNAFPVEGVKALVSFMKDFEKLL